MRKLLAPLIIVFLIFLVSCPEPISQEILNQAEDIHSPRITITSPADNAIYYSTTTITGVVTDDAIESGDSEGIIDSFSYEILYDADRRGGIIRDGSSYNADPDAGSGLITYIPATGVFEFEISTITPSVLSGQITLRITTSDSNANTTIRDLKLRESNGPVITVSEPGTTITEFDTGDDIAITGTLENSNQDSGADQISRIAWNANNAISGSLALDGSDGTFTSTTSQGMTFSFNTSTNVFSSILRVSDTTTGFYVITIEAEDFNGHISTISRTIYREGAGPDFDFSGNTNNYASTIFLRKDNYSPFPIELTFDNFTEVTGLTYQGRSNAGDAALTEISLSLPISNVYLFTPNHASYYTDIQSWLATTEILQLYVTAVNADAEESIHLLNIMLDSLGPAVSIDSISSTTDYNGNTYAGTGTKTIDFSYSDSRSGMDDITLSITGESVSNVDPPETSYDHTFTTGTDGGTVTLTLAAVDVAGNVSSDSKNIIFYYANPTITWSTITSGGDLYAASGETINLSFSSNHVLPTLPTAEIGGAAATVSRVDDTHFTASAALSGATRISGVGIEIDGVTDAAGLTLSAPYTPTTTLIYDPVAPVISTVTSLPYSAGVSLSKNNTVTVTWDAATDGETEIDSVDFDFSELGGGTITDSSSAGGWSASYTISSSTLNTNDADVLITATDLAGNSNSTPFEYGSWIIDTIAPTVTTGNISFSSTGSGTGGTYITGDTITCVWNASADGNTDIASVDFDFSDFGGSTTPDSSSAGGWSASYTLSAGALDVTDAVVVVTATDAAGNVSSDVNSPQISVDTEAPTITPARIIITGSGSGTGGTYIPGDIINIEWSATPDGDTDIASVAFDFSDFGGSTITDSDSTGGWTASYTITAGSTDTAAAVISLLATDDAGQTDTEDSTSVSMDSQAPTVSPAHISFTSSGSGSGGVYRSGDTVSVEWDASSDGDTDISSVEFDFTDFGGTTVTDNSSAGGWTASYTITAGAEDTTTAVVSLTATDDAGISGTSADSSQVSVDNVLPTISSGAVNGTDASIRIILSEGGYSTSGGSGALETTDFSLNFTSGGGATAATISGITHTVGSTTVDLTITYTGTQTSADSLSIAPADGSSIYDQAGNPMNAAQTTGTINLTGS